MAGGVMRHVGIVADDGVRGEESDATGCASGDFATGVRPVIFRAGSAQSAQT
jgi:hypothetical protein